MKAIQIRMFILNMNLDSGLLLPMVWNSILNPPHTHPIQPVPLFYIILIFIMFSKQFVYYT